MTSPVYGIASNICHASLINFDDVIIVIL